jgi:hypothetical protein
LEQISNTEPAIRNTGDSIDMAIEDMTREGASLNIMGPCNGLEIAAARFGDVRGLVHAAYERLQLQKNKAMKELEATWQLATRLP